MGILKKNGNKDYDGMHTSDESHDVESNEFQNNEYHEEYLKEKNRISELTNKIQQLEARSKNLNEGKELLTTLELNLANDGNQAKTEEAKMDDKDELKRSVSNGSSMIVNNIEKEEEPVESLEKEEEPVEKEGKDGETMLLKLKELRTKIHGIIDEDAPLNEKKVEIQSINTNKMIENENNMKEQMKKMLEEQKDAFEKEQKKMQEETRRLLEEKDAQLEMRQAKIDSKQDEQMSNNQNVTEQIKQMLEEQKATFEKEQKKMQEETRRLLEEKDAQYKEQQLKLKKETDASLAEQRALFNDINQKDAVVQPKKMESNNNQPSPENFETTSQKIEVGNSVSMNLEEGQKNISIEEDFLKSILNKNDNKKKTNDNARNFVGEYDETIEFDFSDL